MGARIQVLKAPPNTRLKIATNLDKIESMKITSQSAISTMGTADGACGDI